MSIFRNVSCWGATSLLLGALSMITDAQIRIDLDVNEVVGTAQKSNYAINIWSGLNPEVANQAQYQRRLRELDPDFIRFHASDQTRCGRAKSWVDCTNRRWNKNIIRDVLEEFDISGNRILINIASYPEWISSPNVSAYGRFCGELVRIVNKELGFNVRYWEPINEWDNKGYSGREQADHYIACYNAMKQEDPSIKLVGPVAANPYDETIRPFLARLNERNVPLDLYSFHQYGGGSETNITNIYDRADNFVGGLRFARDALNRAGMRDVEVLLGEWNIYWVWNARGAGNMVNSVGAVFDGLALKFMTESASNAKMFGATAWEDNWTYGKIKRDNSGFNPGGHLLRLFNTEAVGDAVSAQSRDANKVEAFAVRRRDGSLMVAVMNRSGNAAQQVRFQSDWRPQNAGAITRHTISNGGRRSDTVSWSSLADRAFTVNRDNVVVFVTGTAGNQVPVTGLEISNCPSAPLVIGEPYPLDVLLSPVNAMDRRVSYRSADTQIAQVNASGVVSGQQVGTTSVTAISRDGDFRDTCTLAFNEPNPGTLPWVERFSNLEGATSDSGATAWHIDTSSAEGEPCRVQAEELVCSRTRGVAVWQSQVIDISSVDATDIEMRVSGMGTLDNGGQYGDYIELFYRVNGGDLIRIARVDGEVNSRRVQAKGVRGASLELIARTSISAADEFYTLDNVAVRAASSTSPTPAPSPVPSPTLVPTPSPSPVPGLVNAGFEVSVGWSGNFSRTRSERYRGNFSAEVKSWGRADQEISLRDDKPQSISVYYKGVNGRLRVYFLDENGNEISNATANLGRQGNWVEKTLSFTTPDRARAMRVSLRKQYSQGAAYFDQVSID